MTTETRPGRYEHCLINPNVPNTRVFVAPENLHDLGPILAKTLGFAGKVSRLMEERFVADFKRYQTDARKRPLSPILDHLQDKQMNFPQFLVLDKEAARVFLDEAGFKSESISKRNLLLVFQFPKPVAKFWKKGMLKPKPQDKVKPHIPKTLREMLANNSLSQEVRNRLYRLSQKPMKKTGPRPIEWGGFGPPLKKIFWGCADGYQETRQLNFSKLNEAQHHDEDLFHYIFEVSFPQRQNRRSNGNGNDHH